MIDEAAKVPVLLAENFGDKPEPGEYRLSLTLNLPEGWIEAVEDALQRASDALVAEYES